VAGSASGAESAAAALREAERRLVARVGHWNPVRWAAATSEAPGRSRGDAVYALVQVLADLGAEAERRPRRVVPRLPSDLVLPDQVRVMVADLLGARPAESTLAAAQASIDETIKRL
jgi:hypothetical protein